MNPESLLRVPLVRHMLDDRRIPLSPRAIDRGWFYRGNCPLSMVGFNPFESRVFFAAESKFARWLERPEASARALNEGDFLVREVLMAIHDHLHVWALQAIRRLMPELGFGTAPITRESVETFVFCHLLTEAAATVGLDYWYLSITPLNTVLPIGSTVEALTTSYREADSEEYRRFQPDLSVQQRAFLGDLTRFYCTGIFPGFDISDLKRSPKLLRWLKHELAYGAHQRKYIRQWLANFSGLSVDVYSQAELIRPVPADEKWQERLCGELAEMLWAKVKSDHREDLSAGVPPPDECWRSPLDHRPDFRFVNLNRVAVPGGPSGEDFLYYFSQRVSRVLRDHVEPERIALLDIALEKQSSQLAETLLNGQSELVVMQEPRDLLLLN